MASISHESAMSNRDYQSRFNTVNQLILQATQKYLKQHPLNIGQIRAIGLFSIIDRANDNGTTTPVVALTVSGNITYYQLTAFYNRHTELITALQSYMTNNSNRLTPVIEVIKPILDRITTVN